MGRSAVAIEQPTYRRFPERPGSYLVDPFLRHIRRTGQPETFEGIHPGPLPKDSPFQKLTPFKIKATTRQDGQYAPCPMCTPDKFLSGFLIWLPELQAIAAIGHCCAGKDVLAAADREYEARTRRDREDDYLLAVLPCIPQRLSALATMEPAAKEALRLYREIRRADAFQALLRHEKVAHGGRLFLVEEIKGEIASMGPVGFRGRDHGSLNIREIDFGFMRGMIALTSDFNPVRELERIRKTIAP